MSLLQMSFSGAVLILVIVVIRAAAINQLPKKTFLALWIIALARLLVPFSVPSPFSIYSLVRENVSDLQISDTVVYESTQPIYQEPVEESQIGTVVSNTPQESQAEQSAPNPSVLPSEPVRTSSVPIWTIIWSIGMLVPAGSFSVSYFRCRREFRTSLPIENDIIKEWLSKHHLKRKIEIRQFSGILTPLTYGLFHPVILLPENTDWENKQQLQYILYHEYVHIRNYDAVLKLLAAAAICIHWFNPMVWVMYILFNRDIELTCDESVVHNFGRENRSAYAKMLISMEERKNLFTPFFNNFSKNAIEKRIESIMKTKKTSVLALILSVVVVIGTAGCFATSVQEDKNNTEQTGSDQDVETATYDDAYDYLVYPVPEGWSFEKICSLIEIDGTPLEFPCTFDEISNISDNITVEKADTDFNYYDIYYGETNVGTISFKKDTGISDVIKCDYYNDDTDETIHEMTFAGYSAEQETEINDFLAENFTLSLESHSPSARNFYRKVYAFKNNNQKMELSICFENSKLYLIIITLKEIDTLSDSVQANKNDTDITEAGEIKTIEPPEDGWTLEQLNEVLYMNGQKIELPLMLSSLKDGYEIRDKEYKYEDTTGKVGGYLYYKDEFIALITFYEEEADIEILTMLFSPLLYESEQDISSYININGFGIKSKFNDLYNTLGNGFTTESGIFLYKIKNSNYIISIPEIENDFSFYFYQDSNVE